ncbi:hypothetical protein DFH29DRAFT_999026 [Suillus ampliporus]|nr:hypothetical protein DFH29DRAFT_999026 [Suillus ampliporus]
MTVKAPILSQMENPNPWHLTTMPNQLLGNQEVLEYDVCGASTNPPSSLLHANGMVSPPKLENSMTSPNQGVAASRPTMISSSNPALPALSGLQASDAPSSNSGYSSHNFTQGQPLGGTTFDFGSSAMRSNYPPSHPFPMRYPDIHLPHLPRNTSGLTNILTVPLMPYHTIL